MSPDRFQIGFDSPVLDGCGPYDVGESMGVVEYIVSEDGTLRRVRYWSVSGNGGEDRVFAVESDD